MNISNQITTNIHKHHELITHKNQEKTILKDQIKNTSHLIHKFEKNISDFKNKISKLELKGKTKIAAQVLEIQKPALKMWQETITHNRRDLQLQTTKLDEVTHIEEQMIEKFIQEINKKIKEVETHFDPADFSEASKQLPVIFEIENQAREILACSDGPQKQKLKEIYKKKILPQLKKAKLFIKNSPFQLSAQAAGLKGEGAAAAYRGMSVLSVQNPILPLKRASAQEVFLLKDIEVVFKHSGERAREEENNISSLLDLMLPRSGVGSFFVQAPSVHKYGMSIPREELQRAYKLNTLSPDQIKSIKPLLAPAQLALFETYQEHVKTETNSGLLKNYQRMEKKKYQLKLTDSSEPQNITLKELSDLYLKGKIPETALIGVNSNFLTFREHIGMESPAFRALTYHPSSKASESFYLAPDLTNPNIKKDFESCEQYMWTYADKKDDQHTVDFKSFYFEFIQKNVSALVEITPKPEITNPSPYTPQVGSNAIGCPFKIISPQIMVAETGKLLTPLKDIHAKPLIDQMMLLDEFALIPVAKENLLKKLTPEAEFSAYLTGELQFLDLHAQNIGVKPVENSQYEKFKEVQFEFKNQSMSMYELLIEHLNEKLSPDDTLTFTLNGQDVQKKLRDLPELLKALNVSWQFVLFDTDLSLGESNQLEIIVQQKNKEDHFIPLRSALLESDWKDKPLSLEAIELIQNNKERDRRVKNWIEKVDAPIFKRLSPTTGKKIRNSLEGAIERYSLSRYRKNGFDLTTAKLKELFVTEICEMKDSYYAQIWKTIEDELSMVTVRKGDTMEILAKRHGQNPNLEKLRELNSDVELIPGKKIKIEYDLTSSSALKRRERIAAQFFPNLTHQQKLALIERQERTSKYLDATLSLLDSTLKGKAAFDELREYVNKPETPLSTLERMEMLNFIEQQRKSSKPVDKTVDATRKKIYLQCLPTYFNLMKAMYPLLADAYELNEEVYGKDNAGIVIGLYGEPLENTIKFAMASKDPDQRFIAAILQKQIDSGQNHYFFKDVS